MKFIKPILAGTLASVISSIVYIIVAIALDLHRYPIPPGGEIGIDLRGFIFARPAFWLTALAAFALGFWRALRRRRWPQQ